ncbi:MAG: hypothetical protein K6L80_12860 [Agarilytica sp.]
MTQQVLKNVSGIQAKLFAQTAIKYSFIAAPAQNKTICFFCKKNESLKNNKISLSDTDKKISDVDHSRETLMSVFTQNSPLVRLMTKLIKSWGLYPLREEHLRFVF